MRDAPQVRRDLSLLILTVMVCALPFVGQPFHMDDNFYLDMARNVERSPLYPNDTPYVFEGRALPDMGSHSHPPLQTYFLALLQRILGEEPANEWLYHLCALIYPVLAVTALYFIAARFVDRPVWPALGFAVCPLFLVMQHNLMTDVPTLAFWLAAIASFLWASERQSTVLYAASSFFIFAAMFASYQSAALIPLLSFYQIRKASGKAGWIALIVPLLGMAGWFGLNYFHYQRFLLWDTFGYIRSRASGAPGALAGKVIGLLQYQGWLVLFPLFPLLAFGRALRGRLLALAALASIYLAQFVVSDYRPGEKVIFVLGLVSGGLMFGREALLLCRTFRMQADSKDLQFLAFWYFAVAAYCIFVFTEGSARYILPLAPPLLISFFRSLQMREITEYRERPPRPFSSGMIASGSLVLTLAWGLALAHADREFAGIYPRAAREASASAPDLPSYYAGEWGFRYYSRKAGMAQLPVDENGIEGGSLVIRPTLALPYELPKGLTSMVMPFQTLTFSVETPLRILDRNSKAGFYSTGWGLLPFSLSRRDLERLEIGQVSYMVERLPWARIESVTGTRPWPGYLTLEGKAPLAVLAKPGTRIHYSWTAESPLSLNLKCGVGRDSYSVGDGMLFHFEVAQRDTQGAVIARADRALRPGLRAEDRTWQSMQIQLRSRSEGGELLEFRYAVQGGDGGGVGAFAEAYLRRQQ